LFPWAGSFETVLTGSSVVQMGAKMSKQTHAAEAKRKVKLQQIKQEEERPLLLIFFH
jgi:hypothetical protein